MRERIKAMRTALVDVQDGKPIEWVAFDPYGP